MSKNYEKLYNDLKAECEQIKKDNDEICNEYESTIQMLSESIDNFQKEKEELQNKINNLENDIKKYEKEKETLANRNKDKILDIQDLNKANEKLKEELKSIKNENNLTKTKIISLENTNDHYQNKLRQNEALIEDLTSQLESALEENITLQTEFEVYKQKNEEELIRKEQEIKDFQNDISNKEKIIKRLNNKRASIRELKQTLQIPKDLIRQYQRKLTTSVPTTILYEDKKSDINNNIQHHDRIDKSITTTIEENKLFTPLSNSTTKFPSKFMEIYRRSIGGNNNPLHKVGEKNENKKQSIEINNVNIDDSLLVNSNSKNNILSKVNTLRDDTIIEGEVEDKNEKEEIEDENENENENDSTALDKKFEDADLLICEDKRFTIIPIKKLRPENKKSKNKKLADNLKSMLAIIQKRKEMLISHQEKNYMKLKQLGYKIKN